MAFTTPVSLNACALPSTGTWIADLRFSSSVSTKISSTPNQRSMRSSKGLCPSMQASLLRHVPDPPKNTGGAIDEKLLRSSSLPETKPERELWKKYKPNLSFSISLSFGKKPEVQKLFVYEDERDRLSQKEQNSLVLFSNNLYSGDNQKKLGVTAGLRKRNADRYEAIYIFYLDDYGHISVQGSNTNLNVIGGSGVFQGVSGTVHLQQIDFPFKFFYTFRLKGIKDLPADLVVTNPEPPTPDVEPFTN